MSTEDNKATVRHFVEEVLNQGKVALLEVLCAPNFILHEPTVSDVLTREDWKPYIIDHRSAFPNLHFTIEDMIAEGEQVAARYTLRGTNTADFVSSEMHLPATGKQITITGIFFVRFAGGRVVEIWDQGDDLGMYQQLGLIPEPQAVG